MARILLVDDEPLILNVLKTLFKGEGHDVAGVSDGEQAEAILRAEPFDVLLSDIRMTPVNGIELLRMAHAEFPQMPVIMLTAYGSVETASEALKLGAFDYITKPIKVDHVLQTVQRALDCTKYLRVNDYIRERGDRIYRFGSVVAASAPMQLLCDRLPQIAANYTTVLLCGERGTGKELIARTLHENGPRRGRRFQNLNCAELPAPLLAMELFGAPGGGRQGILDGAEGGTVLLNEVSMAPMDIQFELLAWIRGRKRRAEESILGTGEAGTGADEGVVRPAGGPAEPERGVSMLVAASVSDLAALVRKGLFDRDLYSALEPGRIDLPPLRERPADVVPLLAHVVQQCAGANGRMAVLSPEIPAILEHYQWPGNVEELENVVRPLLAGAGEAHITSEQLPDKIRKTMTAAERRGEFGRGGYWALSLKEFLRKELDKSKKKQ